MQKRKSLLILLVLIYQIFIINAQNKNLKKKFQKIDCAKAEMIFSDSFTDDWSNQWLLDGEKAFVESGNGSLKFLAGNIPQHDADHAVLWTKKIFSGNIRIEFDYIRIDSVPRFVNIIYLFASGSGSGVYKQDISVWKELRKIPAMKMYFEHMNAYHISFAAYDIDNTDPENDYIRARRYLPERGKGLAGTDLMPDYLKTGLFKPNVKHHITIIRKDKTIWMKISANSTEKIFKWDTEMQPPISSGRIGLRLMGSRASIISNFNVFLLK
ncbi:MAG: hypothetical protein GZ091_08385 [Paludibacter sp.]|nr:hypothetical protein [Paludibacter sp.]